MRKEVITDYSEKDLLGLQEKEPNVIETLLNSKSRKIKETAAKLIDRLALMYPGRVYLAKSDKLIVLLINILKQEVPYYFKFIGDNMYFFLERGFCCLEAFIASASEIFDVEKIPSVNDRTGYDQMDNYVTLQ